MNSANAQVCLEVSFENHRKNIIYNQKASALLTRFLLYSPHHAESAIHNALSTPSGFLRRGSIERDVVREIIGSFGLCSFESERLSEGGRSHGWID